MGGHPRVGVVTRAVAPMLVAACRFHPGALATDAALEGALDGAPDTPPDAYVAPFCDPAEPTLVACYELEGTTQDASMHHLDASMTNVTFEVGKVGQALLLDATSAVNVAENPALDPMYLTIEAWIAPTTIPTTGTRAGIVDNQSQWGFFLHPNGDLQCLGLTVAAAVAPNTWTHVACTYDGSTRIYKNGAMLGMVAGNGALGSAGTDGISIGADNPPGAGSPFLGAIDELRIFSVARPESELCRDAMACP